ncbi:MAG: hypothetical protein QM692_05625 [Thermomicrobiales bacterium]
MAQLASLEPRTLFEGYFRSADVLLKVYRLLEAQDVSETHEMLSMLRHALPAEADEALLWMVNDLFAGIVRERAQLPASFFRHQNLAMLLRQAVVAACTAMDVYFPALLGHYLPTMIQVKGRNFVPADKEVTSFFRGFTLSLDEHLRVVEDPATQHAELGRLILMRIDDKAMANTTGIAVTLKLLGIEQPWAELARHLGRGEGETNALIRDLVNRRNDIVHRGDREKGSLDAAPRQIDYSWTTMHVRAAESLVLACDELVRPRMRDAQRLLAAGGG